MSATHRINCTSHMMNLLQTSLFKWSPLTSDSEELHRLISTCYKLVKTVRNTSLHEKMRQSVKKFVATRWNIHEPIFNLILANYPQLFDLDKTTQVELLDGINNETINIMVNFLEHTDGSIFASNKCIR